MSELQKLKDENVKLLKEIDRLKKSLEIANYWNDKNNIEKLSLRATNQGIEIEGLKKKLKIAEHFNDLNNVKEVSLRATQRGVIIKNQEKEILELKNEIQKLKNENEKLKSSKAISNRKTYNERGAGRKSRFSNQEKEMIKMYRIQGKTIEEIAKM